MRCNCNFLSRPLVLKCRHASRLVVPTPLVPTPHRLVRFVLALLLLLLRRPCFISTHSMHAHPPPPSQLPHLPQAPPNRRRYSTRFFRNHCETVHLRLTTPMDISPEPSRVVHQSWIADSSSMDIIPDGKLAISDVRGAPLPERAYSHTRHDSRNSNGGTLDDLPPISPRGHGYPLQDPTYSPCSAHHHSPREVPPPNPYTQSSSSRLHLPQGSPAFKNMFYDPPSPPAIWDDLPVYLTKTGQLVAPGRRRAGTIRIFDGSSPVANSSPSTLKFESQTSRRPHLHHTRAKHGAATSASCLLCHAPTTWAKNTLFWRVVD
jgi:hypothetical protein